MKTLIVGGGLSGLAVAEQLEKQGKDYLLLEARARFGGRILTENLADGYFDMGPAWFWPGQPRIAALIQRFNLRKFDQFADGLLTFEDEKGQVQHGQGFSSMEGSWRIIGGLASLTNALANCLPGPRKRLNAEVTGLEFLKRGCLATLSTGELIEADHVVLALPPRIATKIAFSPTLPVSTMQAMRDVATWMAGQAKVVAVYDEPFWRTAGLSGDAMSRHGPMIEIHDASPADGGPFALFGFVGISPDQRADDQRLRTQVQTQLTRLFGPQASAPKALFIKDWASDLYTAVDADKAPLFSHPTYGLPPALTNLYGNRLHFAGTEVAQSFGGYIEGALEAAEHVLRTINQQDRI